jgi:hypothetical protein
LAGSKHSDQKAPLPVQHSIQKAAEKVADASVDTYRF